jgi:hypothetical protein
MKERVKSVILDTLRHGVLSLPTLVVFAIVQWISFHSNALSRRPSTLPTSTSSTHA